MEKIQQHYARKVIKALEDNTKVYINIPVGIGKSQIVLMLIDYFINDGKKIRLNIGRTDIRNTYKRLLNGVDIYYDSSAKNIDIVICDTFNGLMLRKNV